ncbi:MAG: DUF6786 family protein [Sandaracinus sp.]
MRTRPWALSAIVLAACASRPPTPAPTEPAAMSDVTTSFGDDLAFLRAHVPDTLVLARGDARVAVVPSYQGRVMTSSARGEAGASAGWVNRSLIARGEREPHMNAFGGEDRFWLGPEGGQFGLYFPPGAPFDFDHWQVPEAIDWGRWDLGAHDETRASFARDATLVNASGTSFSVHLARTVRLLDDAEIGALVEGRADVAAVGYASENAVTNTGASAWTRETGLLSIWILSMYPPSPRATVVIPFRTDATGPIVHDAYFGVVPADRLHVDAERGVLFFRADGEHRSKIGIPPSRALPTLGSWDPVRGVLTIVHATLGAPDAPYVNSMWETQAEPYGGDALHSYCDGPPAPGAAPLGPFYELESSSPAASLAPGESALHVQTTVHVEGPRAALEVIARARFGVGLDEIEGALAR